MMRKTATFFNFCVLIVFFTSCDHKVKNQISSEIQSDSLKQIIKDDLKLSNHNHGYLISDITINEFVYLMNRLIDNDLINDIKKVKIDTLKFNKHPLVLKILKKEIDFNFNCEILSTKYECKGTSVENYLQIFYFENENDAKKVYTNFKEKVISTSYYEKPYKLFFREKDRIFYTTSDSKITCSGIVIENLSKNFNYEVDYFLDYYQSGKKAIDCGNKFR